MEVSEKIGVAVSASEKTSKRAVKWALTHLISAETNKELTIIHVRQPLEYVNTISNRHVYISELSYELRQLCLRDFDFNTQQLMDSLTKLCTQNKVRANTMVVEADHIEETLVNAILEYRITKLVLGPPSHNLFPKNPKEDRVADYVYKNAPKFCKVYYVHSDPKSKSTRSSRGVLQSSNSPSSSASSPHYRHSRPDLSASSKGPSYSLSSSASSTPQLGGNLHSQQSSVSSLDFADEIEAQEQHRRLSRSPTISEDLRFTDYPMLDEESPIPLYGQGSHNDQYFALAHDHSNISTKDQRGSAELHQAYQHHSATPYQEGWSLGSTSRKNSGAFDELIEKRRRQTEPANLWPRKAFEYAEIQLCCNHSAEDPSLAANRLGEYAAPQLENNILYQKAIEALEVAKKREREEALKLENAQKEVELAMQRVEEERRRQKEAEFKSLQDEEKTIAVVKDLEKVRQQYRIYSFEEISEATDNFSTANIVGEGGYGLVYKGKLHHTEVAIKVLKDNASQGLTQYQHEVEVLGRLHHPHMVLLLGCCPEKGCLIYEYMASGSLEDRLECAGGTPPLPWYIRFQIASEISTALLFLHGSKPDPILHRDLKPGNILLDRNFVSKIGDVGLATLIPELIAGKCSTYFLESRPVGSVAYIDPEYYQSGYFGPKSDIYSLGVVLLRLLTGKPAVGIIRHMTEAITSGSFREVLDRSAGQWPLDEALLVANLAISCTKLSRKDRPDLEAQIIPILKKASKVGEVARQSFMRSPNPYDHDIPDIFLCPILQEVMEDPVVAADGYTYERAALIQWLESHNTSPLTNLPLSHFNLISNVSLSSAITKWKQENPQDYETEEDSLSLVYVQCPWTEREWYG